MSGSIYSGLPTATSWDQWAQGGFLSPAGGPPAAVGPTANLTGSINPLVPLSGNEMLTPQAPLTPQQPQVPTATPPITPAAARARAFLQQQQQPVGPSSSAYDVQQNPAFSALANPRTGAPQAPTAPAQAAQATTNTNGQIAAQVASEASPDGGEVTPGARDYSSLLGPIMAGESAGNPNAKNPNSSASGLYGFTNGTFQSFVNSSQNKARSQPWTMGDKNNPTAQQQAALWLAGQNDSIFQSQLGRPATQPELLAAHLLGGPAAAALAANPSAPAYTTIQKLDPKNVDAVFAGNAGVLNPKMTGGQAIAAAAGYYTNRAPASASGGSAAPSADVLTDATAPASAAAPSGNTGTQDNDPSGFGSLLRQDRADLDNVSPTLPKGTELLALAAGLGAGPTLGAGLSKGLQAMLQVRQQNMQNQMGLAERKAQLDQIGLEGIWRNAVLGIRQQTADNGTKRTNFAVGGGNQALKDNYEAANEIDANGRAAMQQIPVLQNFQAAAANGASPGPDLLNQAKRQIALRLGIDVGNTNVSSVQLGQMLSRAMQTDSVKTMKGLGLRTQNEFNTWKEQAASLDTDPRALPAVMAPLMNKANMDVAIYKKWHDPNTDQATILQTPMGVDNFVSNFTIPAAATQGVGTGQAPGPTLSPNSQGVLVPKPGTVYHYDNQGNPIK